MEWLWAVLGFFLGSIPFSVLIGRIAVKQDIRAYGDGNPGAFNVLRAAGWKWGGLAIFLDIGKGALPVGLAVYIAQISGLPLLTAVIAPVLGHAFSPFLRFNGGKAIATTGGIWIGLTLGIVAFVGMIALIVWYLVLTSSAWAVMFTMITALIFMIAIQAPSLWLIVWGLNLALLIWKHRAELGQPPRFKTRTRQGVIKS
ncbi:MAG: glycerol-3-phosphate acyltransferase [Anaerolineae bacterium]|jgi:glycerol-3-phosphate acyltransferase PlsY|nr:glycerol-3-phosphate acyltransferase [Anaerolineae bacterium]